MNVHGFIVLSEATSGNRSLPQKAFDWIRTHLPFILLVVAPIIVTATYLYVFASDEYQTEAHFTIQSPSSSSSTPSSFGDVLGLTGAMSPSQSEAMGVADYLTSQELVNSLREKDNLVEMYRRPEADLLSRLSSSDPTPEHLLKYYSNMVTVKYNRDTGISVLRVKAFRARDSYKIIQALLEMGEHRVNLLNQRIYADAVTASQRQLEDAGANAQEVERQMTAFRQLHGDIDPAHSGEAQTTLVKTLVANVSAARAQQAMIAKMVGTSNPQYLAISTRVRAMEAEVARQSGELTGGQGTVAGRLGDFEDLMIKKDFAAKRYDAAASALEKARDQAQKQSLYLIRIVDPSMPGKALYPKRMQIVATLAIILLVVYGIGWLIIAGVREHSL